MPILALLRYEVWGFLLVLGATIAYRLLTRQINLNHLLKRESDTGSFSPEKAQLLLATLFVSANFFRHVAEHGVMPDIDTKTLYVFGGSGLIYAAGRAITEIDGIKNRLERKK